MVRSRCWGRAHGLELSASVEGYLDAALLQVALPATRAKPAAVEAASVGEFPILCHAIADPVVPCGEPA
eukprot:206225-Pyramimonas_sp.AAC.1